MRVMSTRWGNIAVRAALFAVITSLPAAVLAAGTVMGQAASAASVAAPRGAPPAVVQPENQKILASDGAELQRFGESVALSGDTAMVGTNDTATGRSAVYVFTRSGGVWTETQKLVAADGAPGDNARFGNAIALDGSTAVIGADGATVGGQTERGAAYVFRHDGSRWIEVAKLLAGDGGPGENFGWSVALSGNRVLVGAPKAQTAGNPRGAAYLFADAGGTWSQVQKIRGVDTRDHDAFGYRVAFADANLVVSAQLAGADFPGALYFFGHSGGAWVQTQKLVGDVYSMFGSSLAAHGNRLVVGAPALDAEGALYVYTGIDGTWSRTHTIRTPEGELFANFGYSVGMTGDAIVAGANAATVDDQSWAGAGYVFTESAGAWVYAQKLVASDAAANDSLGSTAAIDGDTVLLASSAASPGGNFLQGVGYFFTGQAGTNQPAAVVAPNPIRRTLMQGTAQTLTLRITNAGSADLGFTVSEGRCAQPGDIAWLALDDASGNAGPGSVGQVAVTLDAAALAEGAYAGSLCVASNDPDQAAIDVAVDLTVTPVPADPPFIATNPSVLNFAVSSGASQSRNLTIANNGASTLDFSLVERLAGLDPPSHTTALARHRQLAAPRTATLHRSARSGVVAVAPPAVAGGTTLSQMDDNTPGDEGLSCGVLGESTADNSWWRRFYFEEHAQVGASASVTSVTVSSGGMGPAGVPITINLYTIDHATPVDTIPTAGLTLIGSASTTIDSGLVSLVVPVFGVIDDTAGKDLVVEYHTDGVGDFQGQFFPGANATPETHPTFMSSAGCELDEPVTAANLGVPDFHLTMVVTLEDTAPPECRNPADVPWLAQTPTAGSVAPGDSTDVTVTTDATGLGAGTYAANVCIVSNDPVRPVIAVPVSLEVTAGGGGAPIATVTPIPLELSAPARGTGSAPLRIGNVGGSDLTYAIAETATRPNPPSYRNLRQPRSAAALAGATLSKSPWRGDSVAAPVLGWSTISQMFDNSPGTEGVSCGLANVATAPNSWWRRFYFGEHPQVGTRAEIASVTVSSGNTGPMGLPITINLYTLPHGTPVDTIPTSALTLIGTADATIDSGLVSVTVPITGVVDDTVGKDLVVEYHTDGVDGDGQFYPGANATPETHPTFFSAWDCGIQVPTRASAVGYPDFHLTMIVELADEPAPPDCTKPSDIPWLHTSQPDGTVVAGESVDVPIAADATGLEVGTYGASLCVATNDPMQPMIAVPVHLTVTPAVVVDGVFCSSFEDDESGVCGEPPEPGTVVHSGPIDHPIAIDRDGTSIDWITGAIDDAHVPGAPFNAYDNDMQLAFHWLGGAPDSAGVSSAEGASDFLVLQSGAVIGPASIWSTVHNPGPPQWAAGADGYLGFRFNCSALDDPPQSGICYGYVHLRTAAPRGFPATIVDYAYDRSGAAITVP